MNIVVVGDDENRFGVHRESFLVDTDISHKLVVSGGEAKRDRWDRIANPKYRPEASGWRRK